MGTEREDHAPKSAGGGDAAEERRPAVPAFAPTELARRAGAGTRDAPKATPPAGNEAQSGSDAPRTRRYESTAPNAPSAEAARSSLLSMADAMVPSIHPGAPSDAEGGWDDLAASGQLPEELPTRPAGLSLEEQLRKTTSRLRAADPVPEEQEAPTREHPIAPAISATPTLPPSPTDELLAKASTASTEDALRDMQERISLGDYTGALVLAEALQERLPNNAEVKECAEKCRQVLRQMYAARIGPLDRVPVVTVARDQLRWLSIDHRAGFVLSHVDGVSSLELILDVSGMPALEALRILCELAQQRIISFR